MTKCSLKLFCLLILLTSQSVFSQNKISIPQAFANSYISEGNKDYSKAIADLMQVYDAKFYEVNVRLGWLYYYSASYEESQKYYNIAIQLKPNSIESRLGYVLPASALAYWDKVLEQYLEILKIDDKNSTVNYFVGLIYFNRNDYSNAEKYFEKVYGLYPFNYDTVIILALTKEKLKKNIEAKEYYSKALIFYPNDETALEGLKTLE
ncbi:MAG: tetratricopeptide repeat protein [Bacteroidia bacterium]